MSESVDRLIKIVEVQQPGIGERQAEMHAYVGELLKLPEGHAQAGAAAKGMGAAHQSAAEGSKQLAEAHKLVNEASRELGQTLSELVGVKYPALVQGVMMAGGALKELIGHHQAEATAVGAAAAAHASMDTVMGKLRETMGSTTPSVADVKLAMMSLSDAGLNVERNLPKLMGVFHDLKQEMEHNADGSLNVGASLKAMAATFDYARTSAERHATALEYAGKNAGVLEAAVNASRGRVDEMASAAAASAAPLEGAGEAMAGGALGAGALTMSLIGMAAAAVIVVAAATAIGAEWQHEESILAAAADITNEKAHEMAASFQTLATVVPKSAEEMVASYSAVAGRIELYTGETLSATEATELMHTAAEGAVAGNQSLDAATKALIGQITASHAPMSAQAHIMDVLVNISRLTNLTFGEIDMTAGRLQARMGETAPKIEDVGLALALAGQAGLHGQRAIQPVIGMLEKLSEPSDKAKISLAALGGEIVKNADGQLDLAATMKSLGGAFAGLATDEQRHALAIELVGEHSKTFESILAASAGKVDLMTEKLGKSDSAHDLAGKHSDDLHEKTKLLGAGVTKLAQQLGETLAAALVEDARVLDLFGTKIHEVQAASNNWFADMAKRAASNFSRPGLGPGEFGPRPPGAAPPAEEPPGEEPGEPTGGEAAHADRRRAISDYEDYATSMRSLGSEGANLHAIMVEIDKAATPAQLSAGLDKLYATTQQMEAAWSKSFDPARPELAEQRVRGLQAATDAYTAAVEGGVATEIAAARDKLDAYTAADNRAMLADDRQKKIDAYNKAQAAEAKRLADAAAAEAKKIADAWFEVGKATADAAKTQTEAVEEAMVKIAAATEDARVASEELQTSFDESRHIDAAKLQVSDWATAEEAAYKRVADASSRLRDLETYNLGTIKEARDVATQASRESAEIAISAERQTRDVSRETGRAQSDMERDRTRSTDAMALAYTRQITEINRKGGPGVGAATADAARAYSLQLGDAARASQQQAADFALRQARAAQDRDQARTDAEEDRTRKQTQAAEDRRQKAMDALDEMAARWKVQDVDTARQRQVAIELKEHRKQLEESLGVEKEQLAEKERIKQEAKIQLTLDKATTAAWKHVDDVFKHSYDKLVEQFEGLEHRFPWIVGLLSIPTNVTRTRGEATGGEAAGAEEGEGEGEGAEAEEGAEVGLARGASWKVPGSGTEDNVPVRFRATPGEQISVTPAGAAPAMAGAGQSAPGVVSDLLTRSYLTAGMTPDKKPAAAAQGPGAASALAGATGGGGPSEQDVSARYAALLAQVQSQGSQASAMLTGGTGKAGAAGAPGAAGEAGERPITMQFTLQNVTLVGQESFRQFAQNILEEAKKDLRGVMTLAGNK